MDAASNAMAVWTLKEGTSYSVQANRYTAGAGWGGAQTIGSNSFGIYTPRVAVDEQGTATVLWGQSRDGTAADVMVNRFE